MTRTSTDTAVRTRYSAAAQIREAALCCPVEYDRSLLEPIPERVIERDYGCGDPSRYVRRGDTVLDLGSGGGKIAFMAAQVAGPRGSVIGVDTNDEMLALARSAAPDVAERIGYENVRFLRGRIQDLALDLDQLDPWLAEHPLRDASAIGAFEDECARLRAEATMVADGSIDLVVSNCVLNLVREQDKDVMISEIYRVLNRGGRIAISDIVSDEEVPAALRADPKLWSGCVSGAFHERRLLEVLESVGFCGIEIDEWKHEPFAVVDGIEFRSVTVTAVKGKEGPCLEANQAILYKGPWKRVEDDDGHVLIRGERTAVCAKTFEILSAEPYAEQVVGIEPRIRVPDADRTTFDRSSSKQRLPRETKGNNYEETRAPGQSGCC